MKNVIWPIVLVVTVSIFCAGAVTLSELQAGVGIGFAYGQAATANSTGFPEIACKELKSTDNLAKQLAGFPHKYINSFVSMKKLRSTCSANQNGPK